MQVEHALAPARDVVKPVLSSWWTLDVWLTVDLISLSVLWWDARRRNEKIPR